MKTSTYTISILNNVTNKKKIITVRSANVNALIGVLNVNFSEPQFTWDFVSVK